MKSFDVPIIYRSPLITAIKQKRKAEDRMKKTFTPTLLDMGKLKIYLARHFGFCYGVENAIEIAFKTVEESRKSGTGKRIFLLSEMIHNPQVNEDLASHGIRFMQDNYGKELISFDELTKEDIVIIPAFGTTLTIERRLQEKGIETYKYNTTCPFVEKVWNRSEQIAARGYSIVIHGKPNHEETRATFSHSSVHAPAVIIKNFEEAEQLAKYIRREKTSAEFYKEFEKRYSKDFDPEKDLERIGVVNQTTQLASETQAIADYLKKTMKEHYALTDETVSQRFADTRDTLCYATNDNQSAVIGMLEIPADLAIVVGGYNSSNTTHLVELCEQRLPAYFINNEDKILSPDEILHFDITKKEEILTKNFLPEKNEVSILLTSGASCPDALVEGVINKLVSFFNVQTQLSNFQKSFA